MAPLSTPCYSGSLGKRRCSQYVEKPRRQLEWEVGDIAFLRNSYEFTAEDHDNLLRTNYLHIRATCHPVIILDRSADHGHYLITTVSAFSSGAGNNYLPPWEQVAHNRKQVDGFRAFEGSARPSSRHPCLRLADGRSCPKVRTSWVYIHHVFVVPATTLKVFDKTPHRLRMAPESLGDLLTHMKTNSSRFRTESRDPRLGARSHEHSDASDSRIRSSSNTNNARNINNAPQRAKPIARNPWIKPVSQTLAPAPTPNASQMPTPPSSCPSSPDTLKSQSKNSAGTLKPITPPSSPQAPVHCKPAPGSAENTPVANANPVVSSGSKPLWSAIAASGLAASRTSPAGPVSISVIPKGQKQQQQKQKQTRALPR